MATAKRGPEAFVGELEAQGKSPHEEGWRLEEVGLRRDGRSSWLCCFAVERVKDSADEVGLGDEGEDLRAPKRSERWWKSSGAKAVRGRAIS